VGLTGDRTPADRSETAGDCHDGPAIEVLASSLEPAEVNAFGVAQEPGSFVVGRAVVPIEGGDPEGHREFEAVSPGPSAPGSGGTHPGR
jgi:hypothetical protein